MTLIELQAVPNRIVQEITFRSDGPCDGLLCKAAVLNSRLSNSISRVSGLAQPFDGARELHSAAQARRGQARPADCALLS